MGNTNLKCNSCGHEFLGDEYTFSCPSCGGDSLVILNSETLLEKLKNLLYTNRIVAGISVFALLVLGILLWPSGPKSLNAEQSIDVLTFKKEKNHIEIIIRRYSQDLNDNEVLDFDENELFFSECHFEAFSQGSEALTIKDGKIYPCSNGLITIKWGKENLFKNRYKIEYSDRSEIIDDFKLSEGVPSKNAGCRPKLSINVIQNDHCKLTLETNYDTLVPKPVVEISLNGKDGNYSDKRIFTNFPEDTKFSRGFKVRIWARIKGREDNPIQIESPKELKVYGCNPLNGEKICAVVRALGKKPKDFDLHEKLVDFLDGRGTFFVNGKRTKSSTELALYLRIDSIKYKVPYHTKCDPVGDWESVNVYFTNKN